MRRFSKDEIHHIRELAEEGVSLKEISSQIGRCKSAVQYHAAKVRGKRHREKELMIENLTDRELGWLIGLYAGDGSRHFGKTNYSYELKFALNDKEYPIVEFAESLLLKCGMKTWRSIEGRRVYVKCKSKNLYESMGKYLLWEGTKKSKSVRIADFASHSDSFLLGFLCGLIDSDGGTRRLYISTSSRKLTDDIVQICRKLGIKVRTYVYDVYHVYLRKPDFKRVCSFYEFSSIKHD